MIDLNKYGVADRFPKLVRLERVASDLEAARLKTEREVAAARQAVEAAREEDTNAAADALRAGRKPPSDMGKREARARTALESAERTSAAYSRAVEAARHDVEAAYAECSGEIREAVVEARGEASRRISGHVRAMLPDYALVMDSRYDLRALTPPTPPPEADGPGRNTVDFGGVINTRNVYGEPFERGDVEAMLSYLAALEGRFAEPVEVDQDQQGVA
jgi:hypothetical protein